MEKQYSPRQQRGIRIANKKDQIKRIDADTYKVHSQTTNKTYDVVATEKGWICSCPDHIFRKTCCKHIHAVEFSLTVRDEVRKQNEITIEEINAQVCPSCKSENIRKHGIRHNKYGDLQRYSCKACNKRFTINLGFEKMRANPQTITSAMQLYFTGESLRSVQKFLRLQDVNVAHSTVYKWIKKYTTLMESYLDKIIPNVGNTWRADEVYIKVKGDMKYLFALMDDETRFLIAKEVADRKEGHDARGLFRQAMENTGKKPKAMITDGLRSYQRAYYKEFWAHELSKRTTYYRNVSLRGERNNNKMERFNGEFRDRERVVRGVKKTDSPIFSGYQIYHNYVRPHMGLENKTPAEKCGIEIKGKDKWKTLIQNSVRK